MDYSQARAVSLELIGAVESLKHAEELAGVRHPEPHAVVLDAEPNLSVGLDRMDANGGPLARPGELDGVGQQMSNRDLGQTRIAFYGRKLLDLPVDDPSVAGCTQLITTSSTKVVNPTSRRSRSCRPMRERPTRSSIRVAIWPAAACMRSV